MVFRNHFKNGINLKSQMSFTKSFGVITLVMVIIFSMVACGGGSGASSNPPATTESTIPAAVPAISGSNTNELIVEYEKTVEKYTSVVQAIASGDFSESASVETLDTKIKSITNQLKQVESELSDAQKFKITEINSKLASSGN